MSSSGGKTSYLMTSQYNSERLTAQMMQDIGFGVNELVTTRDRAVQYTYFHLKKKARAEELIKALSSLESRGVKTTEIYGYSSIESSSPSEFEHIEDHPGFRTLVQHESLQGSEYHRWTASGYRDAHCGYNLLKSKLQAQRVTEQTSSGAATGEREDGGFSGNSSEEDETVPNPLTGQQHPRPSGSDGERTKRRRSISPRHDRKESEDEDRIKTSDMFRFMKKVYEDTKRKGDNESELREKVTELKYQQEITNFRIELSLKEEELSEKQRQMSDLSAKLELEVETKSKHIADLNEKMSNMAKSKDEEIAGLREEMKKAKEISDSKENGLHELVKSKVVKYFSLCMEFLSHVSVLIFRRLISSISRLN
jgi:hypothetical protein